MSKQSRPIVSYPEFSLDMDGWIKMSDALWERYDAAHKQIIGKVLTLLDAVLSDPEQRKAAKDLVHIYLSSHSLVSLFSNIFKVTTNT